MCRGARCSLSVSTCSLCVCVHQELMKCCDNQLKSSPCGLPHLILVSDWFRCPQVDCCLSSVATTRMSPVSSSQMTAAILCLEGKTTWLWCGVFPGNVHLNFPRRSCTHLNSPEGTCTVCVCFSVIQLDLGHTPEPRHVLSRHSLPITDLHCGLMGAQARIATSSLDQTVKVRLSS